MSEEGGLEEVEESLRAEASCACNWATVAVGAASRACRAVSCACNRSQLAQGVVGSAAMRPYSIPFPPGGTTRASSQAHSGSRMMIGAPWPAPRHSPSLRVCLSPSGKDQLNLLRLMLCRGNRHRVLAVGIHHIQIRLDTALAPRVQEGDAVG